MYFTASLQLLSKTLCGTRWKNLHIIYSILVLMTQTVIYNFFDVKLSKLIVKKIDITD